MNYERIMEAALDTWAKTIKEHSHTFLVKLLAPAFIAAYRAGAMDQSRGKLNEGNAEKAGYTAIRDYFKTAPKRVIKVKKKTHV